LNKRTLDVGSGFSNNVNARVNHLKAQYKLEKWMFPDQAEDTLTQLNLAIVSQPLIKLYVQQWRDGNNVLRSERQQRWEGRRHR
jgi:hypothetical protein